MTGETNKPLVLVVDDSQAMVNMISDVVRDQGYEVVNTTDPTSVPAMVTESQPHVILSDLEMPGMDGFALIRGLQVISSVPIIVLTGVNETEAAVRAVKLGAYDYLTKPIDFEKLFRTLKNAISENRGLRDENRFARYRILGKIGEGGMGVVYKAADPELNRELALKVLRSEYHWDKEKEKRLLEEAQIAANLSHPGLVTIYELGRHQGRIYIAMELVRGKALDSMIREGRRFSIPETLNILDQAAGALAAVHDAGVIHRDVKLSNIMINDSNRLKLLDFGIACLISEGWGKISDDYMVGTLGYMAPEVIIGDRIDLRVDIYSLGVVAFAMLTGRTSFGNEGTTDSLANTMGDEIGRELKTLEGIPDPIIAMIRKMIQPEPLKRFPTMQAVRDEIRKLLA